jgi:hypothetical protein
MHRPVGAARSDARGSPPAIYRYPTAKIAYCRGIAAVGVRFGLVQAQCKRAVVARDRLLEPPHLVQGVPAVVVR